MGIRDQGDYWAPINPSERSSQGDTLETPTHLIKDSFHLGDEVTANGQSYSSVTLYEFQPDGFNHLDTWMLESEPLTYKQRCDHCPNGWENGRAFYWDNQVTFGMAWETFHVFKLYKDEPPVIIAQALGWALYGEHKFDRFDLNRVYEGGVIGVDKSEPYRYFPAHLLKVLRLESGKLVPDDLNPLPEVIMREPARNFRFADVNRDGYDDLVVLVNDRFPRIWLNNHQGQFAKIRNDVFPPGEVGSGDIDLENDGETDLFHGAESSLRDFNGDGLLDLVLWHYGWDADISQRPAGYADRAKWQTGNIYIHFATGPVSISESGMTVEEIWASEGS